MGNVLNQGFKYKFKKLELLLLFFILITPCLTNAATIFQVPYLAQAKVKIYEVSGNGKNKLIWEVVTNSGERLSDIGKFGLETFNVNPDKLYLFEVKGGYVWDVNYDGLKDKTPRVNNGTLRLLLEGNDILEANSIINITFVSELIYEDISEKLESFSLEELKTIQNILSKNYVNDINQDGKIDILDVVAFNPVSHKNYLKDTYVANLEYIISYIFDGKCPSLIPSIGIIGKYLSFGGIFNLKIRGDNIFLASGEDGIFIIARNNGEYKVVNRIETVNVLRPRELEAGSVDIDITKDGRFLFSADTYEGLKIIDIENIFEPIIISEINIHGYVNTVKLSPDEKKLFLTTNNGDIYFLDVSERDKPKLISKLNIKLPIEKVVVNENLLYVATRKGELKIIDINSMYKPNVIGEFKTNGNIKNLVLFSNRILYIVDRKKGIYLLDVSTPKKPSIITRLNIEDNPIDLAVNDEGKFIYVITATNRLYIINIEDIKNTTKYKIVKRKKFNKRLNTIIFNGNRLYVSSKEGLQIFNVINSSELELEKSIESKIKKAYSLLPTNSNDIFYLHTDNSIKILEIDNSYGNIELKFLKNNNFRNIYAKQIVVSKDRKFLYIDTDTKLLIFNIENPLNPYIVFEREYKIGDFMTVEGNNIFSLDIKEDSLDLVITKIEEKNKLRKYLIPLGDYNVSLKLFYKTSSLDYFRKLLVYGNKVFIITYNELFVIDISDIKSPKIGTFQSNGCSLLNIKPVTNNLYGVLSTCNLNIINIKSLKDIKSISTFNANGIDFIVGNNKYIYLLSSANKIYANRLITLKVDSNGRIEFKKSISGFSIRIDQKLSQDYLNVSLDKSVIYIYSEKGDLAIVDVDSLEKYPIASNLFHFENFSKHLQIDKKRKILYVVTGKNNLNILKSENPKFTKVELINSLKIGESIRDLLLSKDGSTLYIADINGFVQILDVRSYKSPVLLSKISLDSNPMFMAKDYKNNLIFILTMHNGNYFLLGLDTIKNKIKYKLNLPGQIMDIFSIEGKVLTTIRNRGIWILNQSKLNPLIEGDYLKVRADSKYIYAIDTDKNLEIIRRKDLKKIKTMYFSTPCYLNKMEIFPEYGVGLISLCNRIEILSLEKKTRLGSIHIPNLKSVFLYKDMDGIGLIQKSLINVKFPVCENNY